MGIAQFFEKKELVDINTKLVIPAEAGIQTNIKFMWLNYLNNIAPYF